jgi:hypothetical protein
MAIYRVIFRLKVADDNDKTAAPLSIGRFVALESTVSRVFGRAVNVRLIVSLGLKGDLRIYNRYQDYDECYPKNSIRLTRHHSKRAATIDKPREEPGSWLLRFDWLQSFQIFPCTSGRNESRGDLNPFLRNGSCDSEYLSDIWVCNENFQHVMFCCTSAHASNSS